MGSTAPPRHGGVAFPKEANVIRFTEGYHKTLFSPKANALRQ